MAELTRFYGIEIRMACEAGAVPHFQARYGDQEVTIEIETGMTRGQMARRALGLVFEWYGMHRKELQENWKRLAGGEEAVPMSPLH